MKKSIDYSPFVREVEQAFERQLKPLKAVYDAVAFGMVGAMVDTMVGKTDEATIKATIKATADAALNAMAAYARDALVGEMFETLLAKGYIEKVGSDD